MCLLKISDVFVCVCLGKNRLYQTYSMSSSETDDSPVHNNNKSSSKTLSKGVPNNYTPHGAQQPSSLHQYTLPYKSLLQQQQQQQQSQSQQPISAIALGNTLTSSSGNASDAAITDTESTVLARKLPSAATNGKSPGIAQFQPPSIYAMNSNTAPDCQKSNASDLHNPFSSTCSRVMETDSRTLPIYSEKIYPIYDVRRLKHHSIEAFTCLNFR